MRVLGDPRVLAVAGAARRVVANTVWGVLVLIWCRSLRISGLENIPDRPVLVVANHASHTDTVLLQFLLSLRHRRPVLVAGAQDYWFKDPVIGAAATTLGVFAFPRRGQAGVRRARRALSKRATVVIFPQGSRSGGRFRPGIGHIAEGGFTEVVPVHISGTEHILPKGSRWPRRADVEIVVGEPTRCGPNETAPGFADRLGRTVLDELPSAA